MAIKFIAISLLSYHLYHLVDSEHEDTLDWNMILYDANCKLVSFEVLRTTEASFSWGLLTPSFSSFPSQVGTKDSALHIVHLECIDMMAAANRKAMRTNLNALSCQMVFMRVYRILSSNML